jgi:bifunctional non-homologous end joining protein LigD
VNPPRYEPMLAVSGRPNGSLEGWGVETKLDGWRALVTVNDGRVHVRSRRGSDLTASLPELHCLTETGRTMVLDGELVVGGGRLSDFYGLAGRLSVRKPTANSVPVTFMAFDLLWLDDQPTIGETYLARRALLESLALGQGCGVIPRYPAEDLDALLSAAESEGLEGVVVKRDRSAYRPGARSRAWAKVKCAGWGEHLERRRLTLDTG